MRKVYHFPTRKYGASGTIKPALFFYLFLFLFLMAPAGNLQAKDAGRIAQQVAEARASQPFEAYELFSQAVSARQQFGATVRDGLVFGLDQEGMARLRGDAPKSMSLEVPFRNAAGKVSLELIGVNIHEETFRVRTSDGRDVTDQVDLGLHYRGMIAGDPSSIAAISIFGNDVIGFISNATGNYELGRIQDTESDYILYRDADLLTDDPITCYMADDSHTKPYKPEDLIYNGRAAGDCVGIYVEAGETVYTTFGNVLSDAINWVNAIFAESFVQYANDGIDMYLSDMLIWTTPDPYDSTGAGDQLALFQALTGSFNGDLAHFIEITPGGGNGAGGIAAGFSGLCNANPDESKCYTGMRSTNYNNIPTYTRNMKVIIHEMGHLLGSRHTHACVWNGNNTQIDDCGNDDAFNNGDTPEGDACFDSDNPILPGVSGGTIMSYCDRAGYTGVNFSLGFHPQVLAVILNNIENAGCLSADCCANDLAEPTALCQDITVQLDASGSVNVSAGQVDDGSFDACGGVSLSLGADVLSFGCDDVGDNPATLTVTDDNGNVNSCSATITVEDNVDPDAVCQDISIYLELDCTASITAADVDGGSSDACGIASMSVFPSNFDTDDVGDNTVTLTVTDNNGNSASCDATVTVMKRPTTLTNLGAFSGQYSDWPVLEAQLTDQLSGNAMPGRTITFALGPDTMTAVTDASGIASTTTRLGYEFPPTALGYSYSIDVWYDGDDCWEPSSDSDVFTVLQEDARTNYFGTTFASTAGVNSGEATVLLMATIFDISSTADAGSDDDPGAIKNATVTFVDRNGGAISPPLPVIPFPDDSTSGTVAYEWNVDIGASDAITFEIGTVVGNYYLRNSTDDDVLVTVSRPLGNFITGGGYIILEDSEGILAGDAGTKSNFGFNVKFNKRGTNLQGQFKMLFRRTEADGILHTYKVEATKLQSLGIDPNSDFAEFQGKANISDITFGNQGTVYANTMMRIIMTDNGVPGTLDLIGMTIVNNQDGLLYSSNWTGAETAQQNLAGGNLVVHPPNGSFARDNTLPGDSDYSWMKAGKILADAYPNPFTDRVTIGFTLPEDGETIIDVISLSGETVTAEYLGMLKGGMIYSHEFTPAGNLSGGVYIYRIRSGEHLATGKLLLSR